MTKNLTLGLLIILPALAFVQPSFADSGRRVAFEACAQELGIQPQPGQRPDPATHEKMDQCMKEKGYDLAQERSAMKACLEKAGIQLPPPGPGAWKNLDASTRAAMKACHSQVENSN